jgi:low affinity Fe/Cu permease
MVNEVFTKFAKWMAQRMGHPGTFIVAVLLILSWIFSGPFFGFSNTWQLLVNTGTTVSTFLMVFLIQNTQNRDSAALHLKLDELIRANHAAHNELRHVENLSTQDLEQLKEQS